MNEESNKIASNALVQIIGRVIILALSLISIKLITTYLGPQGTGYYNTVITYFGSVIVLADFGLFSVAVREISKNPAQTRQLLSNIFSIRIISALLATSLAVIVAFATSYPPEIKYGILAASLFPVFNLVSSVYDMLFQYKLEMHRVVLAEIVSKILAVLALFLIIYYQIGYYAVVFTVPFAAIIGFIIKAYPSRNQLPLSLQLNSQIVKPIMKMALPLGIVFIVNNIYFKIDTLLLFYFKGATSVGIYAVAYRVLETTLFAGSYLSSSLKPLLSTSLITDNIKAEKAIRQGIVFMVFMSLAITIMSTTFSREIILFLSNRSFQTGSQALFILGFVPIFLFTSGLLGEIMIAKDMRRTLIKLSVFILTFNVLLNIYLIPRYSFIGAAYATLISEIALVTTGFLIARKQVTITIDYIRIIKLFFIALFCILLGFTLKNTSLYFLLNLALILAIYLLLAYKWSAIPQNSVNSFLASLRSKIPSRPGS